MNEYEFSRVEMSDGRFAFQFTTVNGVFFLVEFRPTGYVFENVSWADSCYDFSIRPRNESTGRAPYDARTGPTIDAIFRRFFGEHDRVVIYICETADGRHEARVKKFNRWFKQFDRGEFLKLDRILHDGKLGLDFFISLIMQKNNPRRDEISTSFNQRMDEFSAEK